MLKRSARGGATPLVQASSISEKPGAGLRGIVDGVRIKITGRSQVQGLDLPEPTTGLECIVLFDDRLAAVLRFRDTPREESRPFIAHLKSRHVRRHVVLLSGDREEEVRYLAGQVGISEVHFGKSPEEKVAIRRGRHEAGKDAICRRRNQRRARDADGHRGSSSWIEQRHHFGSRGRGGARFVAGKDR